MPRKVNEVSAKCQRFRVDKLNVNVKHSIGPHREIAIGKEIIVKLNPQHYHTVQ